MADLKTLVEREMDRAGSPSYAFEDLVDRRDRKRRNQRIAAGVVGILIAIAVAAGGAALLRSDSQPADVRHSTLPPILREDEFLTVTRNGWIQALDPLTGELRRIVRPGCDFQDEDCNTFLYRYEMSADGRWLAYDLWTCVVSEPCDPVAGIWVTNAAGQQHHLTYLCDPPGTCPEEEWAWSPQGSTLAAYAGEDGGTLVTIDPTTGEPTTVADPGVHIEALAWSPDGARIAYATNGFVHVVDLATGRTTPAIEGIFAPVHSLAWSPDGTQLVIEDGLGDGRILVGGVDGSQIRDLVSRGRREPPGQPSWSPDGSRIAYYAMPPLGHGVAGFEVWIVGADGSDATRVVSLTADCCPIEEEGGPIWSPEGDRIAFSGFFGSPRRPGWMVVNTDGKGSPEPIGELEIQDWRSGR